MSQKKIGILGGGQLAQMLVLSGHPLGLSITALTSSTSDPAAHVLAQPQQGSPNDTEALKKFVNSCDVVTFESEFIDIEKIKTTKSIYFFPSLKAIQVIQDRLTQKQLLDKFKIPTSPWLKVDTASDLESAGKKFKNGLVLKQRRNGYDGYGTFIFNSIPNPSILNQTSFGFIAEKKIHFKRELAFSMVRSRSGKILDLPLVESVQVNSRCFSVCGPVKHKKIKAIKSKFSRLMKDLNYVGILAVELFDTGNELLVNELAPRVHNSAHYSQNGLTCSQFEYHLRAGLDLPLPKVELVRPGFAMVNLLGEGSAKIHLSYSQEGFLHWYSKSENRENRKLGHINVIGPTPKNALKKALKWRKEFKL